MFSLLKVSQGKFTTECINFLVENGYAEDLAVHAQALADRAEP